MDISESIHQYPITNTTSPDPEIRIEQGGPAQSLANSRRDKCAKGSGSNNGQHSQVDTASDQARCPSPRNRLESAAPCPACGTRRRPPANGSGVNAYAFSLFYDAKEIVWLWEGVGDSAFKAV